MRLRSPIRPRRVRLEIIPLIDIMFFLLAAFMMVSITMIRVEALKMDLPTATTAKPGSKPPVIEVEVDALGDAYVGSGTARRRMTLPDLYQFLRNHHQNAARDSIPALIKGNPAAKHGQMIAVLDTCRRAGINRVSFHLTASER